MYLKREHKRSPKRTILIFPKGARMQVRRAHNGMILTIMNGRPRHFASTGHMFAEIRRWRATDRAELYAGLD